MNNKAMVPRISRETVKLRMAYVLYDFWGLRIPTGSKALYDGMNARGWYWYPSKLCWGQLNKDEGDTDNDGTNAVTI